MTYISKEHRPKTHLCLPDQHADPRFHNDRADWLGQFMKDVKPDVVINMGDAADLSSLSLYDKGKASFHGRSYEADITSHLDFQDRLWQPVLKAKKKLPRRVVLEGNHEHRIKRALDKDPELKGSRFGLSFKDLAFDDYYQEVVEYSGGTPGTINIDGVTYAHYMVSGLMGRPIGGEHHAYSLIAKHHCSCTVGHSHTVDFSRRYDGSGRALNGMVCGVYQDYQSPWAGEVQKQWTSGVLLKKDVEDGNYSFEWVNIDTLRKEYGTGRT